MIYNTLSENISEAWAMTLLSFKRKTHESLDYTTTGYIAILEEHYPDMKTKTWVLF